MRKDMKVFSDMHMEITAKDDDLKKLITRSGTQQALFFESRRSMIFGIQRVNPTNGANRILPIYSRAHA